MTEDKIQKLSQQNSETASTTVENLLIPKTLLIFDFADTLFCTKYFDSFSLPYQDIFTYKISLEQVNHCLFKEIKELEKTIIELFMKLENFGYDFVIVSNADIKWINNCLTHFLEELKEYINENKIRVYSAKNMFSNLILTPKTFPARKESSLWKIKCFEKVINDLYYEENNDNVNETYFNLNVISIGDGEDEKRAVFKLNKNKFNFCQNLQSKFIRMIDYPSASSIIIQLEYLQNNIIDLLNSNNAIYKMIIEICNGTAQIKCIPKKKNVKVENIKNMNISSPYIINKKIKKVLNENIDENEEDIFFFNYMNEYEELVNSNFYDFLDKEQDIIRKNLFIGKKQILNKGLI